MLALKVFAISYAEMGPTTQCKDTKDLSFQ